jgi:hypothetical protein
MTYLQLYSLDCVNQLSTHLGSDGVVHIDGRWSIDHIHEWALEQSFNDRIVAYQICKSPDNRYSNSHPISSIITLR